MSKKGPFLVGRPFLFTKGIYFKNEETKKKLPIIKELAAQTFLVIKRIANFAPTYNLK